MKRADTLKTVRMPLLIILLIIIDVWSSSCSFGTYARTESASESEIAGTYTLFLYGGTYLTDLETVAILSKEGLPYVFDIYAPDFNYQILRKMPAKDAIEKTAVFVSRHPDFQNVIVSKIIDGKGNILGYEIKPLYRAFTYGTSDVLDVDYSIKGNRVVVYIKLKPSIENMFMGGGGRDGGASGH
ncbi:MAG: hypothetical protein ACLPX5_03910 [Dissulfurispiraceae bacterium]